MKWRWRHNGRQGCLMIKTWRVQFHSLSDIFLSSSASWTKRHIINAPMLKLDWLKLCWPFGEWQHLLKSLTYKIMPEGYTSPRSTPQYRNQMKASDHIDIIKSRCQSHEWFTSLYSLKSLVVHSVVKFWHLPWLLNTKYFNRWAQGGSIWLHLWLQWLYKDLCSRACKYKPEHRSLDWG